MITHVIGFKSDDSELFKKHEAVLKACVVAEIKELPKETALFFGDEMVDISLLDDKLEVDLNKCLLEYFNDGESGYELKVKDIPAEVDIIRFCNKW